MQPRHPELSVPAWHSLPVDEVLRDVESSAQGLPDEEAQQRLAKWGSNVIQRASSTGIWKLLWQQVNSPLIWVLNGSAILAMALGKRVDGAVVLAVVVINTIIGFIQEFRAGKAIDALVDMVPENATVIREGKRCSLPVADLVPGDVVVLGSGDRVPADIRLIATRNLRLQEAALTGESLPTEKSSKPVDAKAGIGDRSCMAFGGTLVTFGTGTGVVVTTGNKTELGRISTLLREVIDLETPLTKALEVIGKVITVSVLVVSLIMVIIGVARMVAHGMAFTTALKDALVFAIALAVGAIPEGLPAIVTIALAIGVQRMAARRAIVRQLPAVETLGSTTTICSDKTGTLTRNEMTVQALWTKLGDYEVTGVGYEPTGELKQHGRLVPEVPEPIRDLGLYAALCNDAEVFREQEFWKLTGDPTEGALVTAAMKLGIAVDAERKHLERVSTIPFESENQFMATIHRMPDEKRLIVMKGAPEVVLGHCSRMAGGDTFEKADVLRKVEELARRGMRVLAIATKRRSEPQNDLEAQHVEREMELVGLVGMLDPPRREAIAAIETCKAAGIAVKMITGDHQGTAAAIGEQLGLTQDGTAITGATIEVASDQELQELVRSNHVFARVAPEHKLRLVRALQADGQVVAMTGDGVNDAPALKQSNIGVAMGITGTAASREAADIVLTDDNFASIAAAVEEGRRVYDNLIKSLAFVLPTNLGLAFILIYAVAFFPFNAATQEQLLPILPVQLLWINLVAAVSLALPLAFEAKEPDIMLRPPRSPREPVLNRFVVFRTVLVAVLMTAGAIGLFYVEYHRAIADGVVVEQALREAQTIAVTTVIVFQIFYLMNCRSLKGSVFEIGLFSNRVVFIGIGVVIALQAAFIYVPFLNEVLGSAPLGLDHIGFAVAVGASILPVISVEKWWRKRNDASLHPPAPGRLRGCCTTLEKDANGSERENVTHGSRYAERKS
ncbi:MAG: cation-translocating P-type ATPase [Myxococcales bacterium]